MASAVLSRHFAPVTPVKPHIIPLGSAVAAGLRAAASTIAALGAVAASPLPDAELAICLDNGVGDLQLVLDLSTPAPTPGADYYLAKPHFDRASDILASIHGVVESWREHLIGRVDLVELLPLHAGSLMRLVARND